MHQQAPVINLWGDDRGNHSLQNHNGEGVGNETQRKTKTLQLWPLLRQKQGIELDGLTNIGPLVGDSKPSGRLCGGTCVGPGDIKEGHRISPGRKQFSGEDTILMAISDTCCSGGMQ